MQNKILLSVYVYRFDDLDNILRKYVLIIKLYIFPCKNNKIKYVDNNIIEFCITHKKTNNLTKIFLYNVYVRK